MKKDDITSEDLEENILNGNINDEKIDSNTIIINNH